MCAVVRDYFVDIFDGVSDTEMLSTGELPHLISSLENDRLTAKLEFPEFKRAIFEMHPDKTPGPDGLNPAFYQHFWDVMGVEVFNCCKEWLEKCSIPAKLNNTNIVLIPKKTNPTSVKDLRPISLYNVLYKIMAKVLSNRLKNLLPGIVSENQSAFVPGRSINDNVLVSFEIVHYMKRKHRGLEGDVAIKLDISKANDRVSWSYLRAVMRRMGFCSRWIDWIMMFVSTVFYNIAFNDAMIGPIVLLRGLR